MPSKTFATADATTINFAVDATGLVFEGNSATTSPLAPIIAQTGIGSWELTINRNFNQVSVFVTVLTGFQGGFNNPPVKCVTQTFSINFNRLSNPIPDSALIKKLTWRRPKSINISCTSIPFSGPPGTNVSLIIGDDPASPFLPPQFSDYPGLINSTNFINPIIFNQNIQGSDADIILFDFTDSPTFLTKAQLIASWSNFENGLIAGTVVVEALANPAIPAQVIMAGTMQFGSGWVVTVEYEEFQWSISQDPSTPINQGSTVNLVSPVVVAPEVSVNFTQVTQIDILVPNPAVPGTFFTVNVPSGTWSNITANTLNFIMPNWPAGNLTPSVVRVVLTSTQFTGTVARQLYTIFLVSASGIYELVQGKNTDTLYIEEEPGQTIDVKIPNPFGRPGFFGK